MSPKRLESVAGIHILLVDENRGPRDVMRIVLECEKLTTLKPHVLITDLVPRLEGVALVRALRAVAGLPGVPIVGMTACPWPDRQHELIGHVG